MKRNLRKMDEPPGKHPLFIPLVLQMITNALSPPFFSLRAHTALRSGAEGGVADRGEVDRQRERVFMPQCLTNKRGEKAAEGHTTKRPDWPEHSAHRLGRRRRFWCGMTTRQRIYPPSTLRLH